MKKNRFKRVAWRLNIAFLMLILFSSGLLIGWLIIPNKTIYNFPNLNFVKNVNSGEGFNATPEDIITSYRIECESIRPNGDVIRLDMCEECWEGIDCFQKTWDTVYQHYPEIFITENISNNATDFCDRIIKSGFFAITWKELEDYGRENNLDSNSAYKSLHTEKCNQNLSIFDVKIVKNDGDIYETKK